MSKASNTFKCLHCGHHFSIMSDQCPQCGVIFDTSLVLTDLADGSSRSTILNHVNRSAKKKPSKKKDLAPSISNNLDNRSKKHGFFGLMFAVFQSPFKITKNFLNWLLNTKKTNQIKKISFTTLFTALLFISIEYGLVRYLIQQAVHVRIITDTSNTGGFINQISLEILENWRKSFPTRKTLEYFLSLLIIWASVLTTSWFSSVISRARTWNDEYDEPPPLNLSIKDISTDFTLKVLGIVGIYHLITLLSFYIMSGGRVEVILTTLHHIQTLMTDPIRVAAPSLATFLDFVATAMIGLITFLYFQFQRQVLSASKFQAMLLSLPPVLLIWLFNVL